MLLKPAIREGENLKPKPVKYVMLVWARPDVLVITSDFSGFLASFTAH